MKQSPFLLFLFLLLPVLGWAQVPDSILNLADTAVFETLPIPDNVIGAHLGLTPPKKKRFLKKFFQDDYPNPKKAALFSFVLPGAGQAYNKSYWKIPIVWSGVGTMVYFIGFNTRNYNRFKTAYRYRVDGDESTVDEEFADLYSNAADLKTIRDGYRKNMELSWIGLVAVLALNATDAFVDAHLLEFDVDEDISLRVKPGLQPGVGRASSYNLGLEVAF